MRTYLRIATVAGVALAWAGLWLAWERWAGLNDSDTTTGFDLPEAEWFRYGLIAVTVLAMVYLYRLWRPVAIALTIAALVLLGLTAHAALDLFRTSSTFIDVGPGLGLWLSAAGAVVLIVASKPNPYAFAAGLVPLAALVIWSDSGRPADGHVALASSEIVGPTQGLDDDTVLYDGSSLAFVVYARDPDGVRYRKAFDLSDVNFGISDRIVAIARQGDDLYLTVNNHGVVKVRQDGRAELISVGPVKNPGINGIPDTAQRIDDFYPSRLAAAPDGSVYVLSGTQVYRYDGKRTALVATPSLKGPQDIAVDRQNRLYIADSGNGRVVRVDRDGKAETLIGASAPPGCEAQGLDDPGSLDPSRCHVIEALAVDSKGNLFVATSGVPRVLALTADGRFGVVAGTGVAGTALGDGRAVSAQIGGVNTLAIGPGDELFVTEFYRALRIADPVSGFNQKPAAAAPAPRQVCAALGKWGAATLQAKLVTATNPPPTAELVAALKTLDDEPELTDELAMPRRDSQEWLAAANSTIAALLKEFGHERCGLAGGLYPISDEQTKRFCTAYIREWGKVNALKPSDERNRDPGRKAAALLPASIFPPRAPRTSNWEGTVRDTARHLCAVPYRWATEYSDLRR